MSDRKTICFDLDGTLCTNTFGEYEDAEPFPWAVARVNALADAGHRIIVLTARGFATGLDWDEVTRGQLARWGVRYEALHFGKPNADVYVDDRAVHTDAWRVSDRTRPPGFARALGEPDDELPAAPAPERTAVIEVARTFGGRLLYAREHAELVLGRAEAAGLRLLPAAAEVEQAMRAAADTSAGGEDLIVTVALAAATHAALLETWRPAPGAGLHVAVRRLDEAAAGLQRFRDGDGIAATLDGGAGWPLADDPRDGAVDALGGQLGRLEGETLALSPGPAVAGDVLAGLARERGLRVEERRLTVAELAAADELMVVGMPFCLLPVTRLDGRGLDTDTGTALVAAWGEAAGRDLVPA
jgi:hypothetical protein